MPTRHSIPKPFYCPASFSVAPIKPYLPTTTNSLTMPRRMHKLPPSKMTTCIICTEHSRHIITLHPCRHSDICQTCFARLPPICPLCRTAVTSCTTQAKLQLHVSRLPSRPRRQYSHHSRLLQPTLPVARQAQSSSRPRHLSSISTGTPTITTKTLTTPPKYPSLIPTVLLVSSQPLLLRSLSRKLTAQNPSKSILLYHNLPIRLVAIPPSEIRNYTPSLVILCADYFDVPSFEQMVRLDMDLDLDTPVVWTLLRHGNKLGNCVADADVQSANHFITPPRPSFLLGPATPLIDHIYKLLYPDTKTPNTDFKSLFCLPPPNKMHPKPRRSFLSRLRTLL